MKGLDAIKHASAVHLLDVKALGEKDSVGAFEGYASTFGNVDSFGEKVMPGAFIDSLVQHKRQGTRVKMFAFHDSRSVVGRWVDMAEDAKGLFVKGQLNMKVQKAVELRDLMVEGDIDGLSIGFRDVKSEMVDNVVQLQQIDLLEISIVSLPANTRATVDDVKSVTSAGRFEAFCQSLKDGKPLPAAEFEDILRDAGVPKSMATRIASVGYARAIRSDSESEAEAALLAMRESLRGFQS